MNIKKAIAKVRAAIIIIFCAYLLLCIMCVPWMSVGLVVIYLLWKGLKKFFKAPVSKSSILAWLLVGKK